MRKNSLTSDAELSIIQLSVSNNKQNIKLGDKENGKSKSKKEHDGHGC